MSYASGTKVSDDRSRAEIENLLMRYGAEEFGYMSRAEEALIGFKCNGMMFEIRVVMPPRESFGKTPTGKVRAEKARDDAWMQERRRRWRSLALVIKAKLVAVADEVCTFEHEFLPYMVTASGKTVADHMAPLIEEAREGGQVLALPVGRGA